MCSLQGVYTSRGIPRIANAARAGHSRGPYAVRRVGRGIPRFVGAAAFPELRIQDAGGIPQAKKEPALSDRFCVGVTYFPGQSPGKYRRRRCA